MSSPFVIVGLGNPGEKYERSRHNIGRMVLEQIAKERGVEVVERGKHTAHVAELMFGGVGAIFLLPNTYMNKSGSSVKTLVTSSDDAKSLIVVYDDIDLPWGTVRIAWNRGSGGHNGVESVVKAVKTKEFIRIRIGVAPTSTDGTVRKPKGEDAVVDFLMGDIGKREEKELPNVAKRVESAIELIISKGLERAMNETNSV